MKNTTPMPARRVKAQKTYPVCSLSEVLSLIESKCGDVHIVERHGKGLNKVIILPEAARELEVMISYGRRSPMNENEQKYVGYGHYLADEGGHIIIIVKHFIEIQTMNRNAIGASNLGPNGEYNPGLDFLEYHREEFMKNEAKYNTDAFECTIDPFLKMCGPSEYVLEGHTHPDLGVFFSDPDKVSGAARAASAPVCIFVCDPIRRKMLGSVGKDFAEAEVVVYSRHQAAMKEYKKDERLNPTADELMRFTGQCLRIRGYAGNARLRTRMDGKICLRIKLVIPKMRRGKDNEFYTG